MEGRLTLAGRLAVFEVSLVVAGCLLFLSCFLLDSDSSGNEPEQQDGARDKKRSALRPKGSTSLNRLR